MKQVNILNLLVNLSKLQNFEVKVKEKSQISINRIGDSLETFIKNLLADINEKDSQMEIIEKYSNTFSYQGNQNNPPDLILRNSDAIEVKKISGYGEIALNSSYPKNKLYSNDKMLIKECQNIENGNWIKDLFYIIGTVNKNNLLENLFIIEGNCYCGDREIYERVKNKIKSGVESINGVEFSETKELGKVKKVDPLGITDLRVRGMWSIDNPFKVFSYISEIEKIDNKTTIYTILSNEKYNKFDKNIANQVEKKFNVIDIKVQSPNNPSNLINSKLIKVEI